MDPRIDQLNCVALQATMNSFGSLEWEFTTLTKTINFMDVQLMITPTGMLYEEQMICIYTYRLSLHMPPASYAALSSA
jgi:hypothetical protein